MRYSNSQSSRSAFPTCSRGLILLAASVLCLLSAAPALAADPTGDSSWRPLRLFSGEHDISERMAEMLTSTYSPTSKMMCRGEYLTAGSPPSWGFGGDVYWDAEGPLSPMAIEISDEHGPLAAAETTITPAMVVFKHVKRPNPEGLPPAPRIYLHGYKYIHGRDILVSRLMFYNDGATTLRFQVRVNSGSLPESLRKQGLAPVVRVMDSRTGGKPLAPTGPIEYALAPRKGAVLRSACAILPSGPPAESDATRQAFDALCAGGENGGDYYNWFEQRLPTFDCGDPMLVHEFYENAANFRRATTPKPDEQLHPLNQDWIGKFIPRLIEIKQDERGAITCKPLDRAAKLEFFLIDGLNVGGKSITLVWRGPNAKLNFAGPHTRRENLPTTMKPGFTLYTNGTESAHAVGLETIAAKE